MIRLLNRPRPAATATVCLLLAGGMPTAYAGPRIASIEDRGGKLSVSVQGAADPLFATESGPLAAAPVEGPGGEMRWELPAEAAEASRLVVSEAGDSVALAIGTQGTDTAPFNDWVIYHIMMAYFANGTPANDKAGFRHWIHPNYAGGDLQGVLQKADYLADLGVNAVWLSPVFASETSHGYDVTNYYAIGDAVAVPKDPDASMALYGQVVDALHQRGIRVVLDLPLDYGSGAYDRRAGDPNRRRPRSTGPIQEAEKMWASWGTDFQYWRFSHENTRKFLIEVALFWLTEGRADGLRLDYVRGIPHDFWAELYAAVKSAKPEAFLFGEAWQDGHLQGPNAVDIATYYAPVPGIGPQFDGLLDFPMKITMTDVFARGGHAALLEEWLQRTAALYGDHGRPVNFLDNHDMARFLAWAGERGEDKLVAALTFMASLSSPMVIFYGSETGIRGGAARGGFTDNGREPMPWGSLDQELIDRFSAVLAARAANPAMSRGGRRPLHADEETLVMIKTHDSGDLLVGVNAAAEPRTLRFPAPAATADGLSFRRVLGDTVPSPVAERTLDWTLAPNSTFVAAVSPGDAVPEVAAD